MRKKIVSILTILFSILLTIGLIVGFIFTIIFAIGFIIGGDTSATICGYISSQLLPYEYLLAEITTIIGMIKMYLNREKTFVMDTSPFTHKKNR